MADSRDKRQLAEALEQMMGSPAAPSEAEAAPASGSGEADPVSLDDAALAPPPDESVFAPRRSNREIQFQRLLQRQRTMIPILLTLGVLLPAIASLKWLLPDTPFGSLASWLVALMFLAGPCLLVVATLNILHVRGLLRGAPASKT